MKRYHMVAWSRTRPGLKGRRESDKWEDVGAFVNSMKALGASTFVLEIREDWADATAEKSAEKTRSGGGRAKAQADGNSEPDAE